MSRLIARLSIAALGVAAAMTATTNGPAVDVSRFTGLAKVSLNSSAMGAAGTTSNTKLQHSADGSTNWVDVPSGAFAQVTNAGSSAQDIMLNTDSLRKFVRVVDTLAGTTPTVTRSVTLIGTIAY